MKSEKNFSVQTFEARFRKIFLTLTRPHPGHGSIVSFSGGADSTALLSLCQAISGELEMKLTAAHLDHGLRGLESQRDREASEATALRLGVPFVWAKADCQALARAESLSLEEAARKARYRFLERVRREKNADYIVTGHTADDNAEVLLLNLMRGAGPQGLAGIPPIRDGHIIRPLLTFWKSELLAYIKARGLGWVEDSSNKNLNFTRNRVRHDLIPKMAQDYNPAIKAALSRTAQLIREEESAWELVLTDLKPEVGWLEKEETVRIHASKLAALNRAVGRRLVRAAFKTLTGQTRALTKDHIEHILDLASSSHRRGLDLPGGFRAWFEENYLFIGPPPDESVSLFEYSLTPPGRVQMREIGLELLAEICDRPQDIDPRNLGPSRAILDLNKLSLPLIVRTSRPGDRFQPLGMKGTKKLHDIFIDGKVEARQRPKIPVVLDQRGIVWVGGFRISDRVRLSAETRQAVLLSLKKSELHEKTYLP
ncbi:MAG: tRNA lysidine(34) synthetase TilS [Deltaproteobacteria bacterium]|nr:tRNA lysidine(34) synthetase TilS [Deltaproteobacteria bacterium]